jgi:[ribosomal protein S18]-alanine N-acetyltransferase
MQFNFSLMMETDVHTIKSWQYKGPYAVYNINDTPGDLAELLDRRSPYYAVRNEEGELIGFFVFGTSAQVGEVDMPGLYSENNTISVGLGMRPDLTGKGLGLAFVKAGLDFAREQFKPDFFRLFVLTFNERAIRVYERAGFQHVRVFVQRNIHGERKFLEMSRHA